MGREVWSNQPRNKGGQWIKRSMLPFISLVVIIGFGMFMLFNSSISVEYHALPIINAAVATSTPQIEIGNVEAAKDKLVNDISACETKGVKEPDATILLDSNSQMSIGSMQFQIKTVQHYVKLFEKRDINRVEAIQIAIDHDKAHELAKKIIFEDSGKSYKNWWNCSEKLNIGPKVELLKQLTSGK